MTSKNKIRFYFLTCGIIINLFCMINNILLIIDSKKNIKYKHKSTEIFKNLIIVELLFSICILTKTCVILIFILRKRFGILYWASFLINIQLVFTIESCFNKDNDFSNIDDKYIFLFFRCHVLNSVSVFCEIYFLFKQKILEDI